MEYKECPFCHSEKIEEVENDKFDDLYYCNSCEHRFRYNEFASQTIK